LLEAEAGRGAAAPSRRRTAFAQRAYCLSAKEPYTTKEVLAELDACCAENVWWAALRRIQPGTAEGPREDRGAQVIESQLIAGVAGEHRAAAQLIRRA